MIAESLKPNALKSYTNVVSSLGLVLLLGANVDVARGIELVSVNSSGEQGNGNSSTEWISRDGRFVAFSSRSDNLDCCDSNGLADVFLHDTVTGDTQRISDFESTNAQFGSIGPVFSPSGKLLAFLSDVRGPNNFDIYVHDLTTGRTEPLIGDVTPNGRSFLPAFTGDDCEVAFASRASNLVLNDENNATDIFIADRCNGGTIERVSLGLTDEELKKKNSFGTAISDDGCYLVLGSVAPIMSSDTNNNFDIFLLDRCTTGGGSTTYPVRQISVNSSDQPGNGGSFNPSVSASGRFTAFQSDATNLVEFDGNGKTDIFVHDQLSGVTERVSVATDGTEGNGNSTFPAISADGRFVVFRSDATNLVDGDTNEFADVFVHDRQTVETQRVSVTEDGTQGDDFSAGGRISGNGRFVAFASRATNLVANDENGIVFDVLLADLGERVEPPPGVAALIRSLKAIVAANPNSQLARRLEVIIARLEDPANWWPPR